MAEQKGNLLYALIRYQQALDVEPRNVRALVETGRVYEAWHYPERALVLYERALDDNPNQPELRRHVAEMHARGVGPPRPN
jgi:tetratricopeptide (TPR) repeat protein